MFLDEWDHRGQRRVRRHICCAHFPDDIFLYFEADIKIAERTARAFRVGFEFRGIQSAAFNLPADAVHQMFGHKLRKPILVE